MQFLRRLGLSLTVSLFSLLLLAFAIFLTVYKVLDTPPALQNALRTSGIYDVFVQNTLAQKEERGEIDLTGDAAQDEVIRRAVTDAFEPASVRQAAEQNLNRAYDWLHGKTPQLELAVDLTEPRVAFADTVAAQTQTRASELPICPGPAPVPRNLEELLAASCRPAIATPQMIGLAAHQLALTSNIFDQLNLTTDNFKDEQGRPLGEKLQEVPEVHRYFIWSLYIIPVVLVLCALAIVFWSATRRGGTKRVARILLWAGLLSAAWALVAAWGLNRIASMITANTAGLATAVQDSIMRAVNTLAADLRLWWLVVSGAYVLAALILFIVVRIAGKQTTHQVEELNKSLGYGQVPSAGTTFDPKEGRSSAGGPGSKSKTPGGRTK